MTDLSHLDAKYFLDGDVYNCPFCNRRSVAYTIIDHGKFNWSKERTVYLYLVRCDEGACLKVSMHLSYFDFRGQGGANFATAPKNVKETFKFDATELDQYFFYHQPTSFFAIDSRIPETLRKLIAEAEGCLKMNFLVGASACVRKTIYELIDHADARILRQNGRTDYQGSIKGLKEKFPSIDPQYFDALGDVQELASDNVHEGSWSAWSADKLRDLLELTLNVLHEIYVIPDERKHRLGVAAKMLRERKASITGAASGTPDSSGLKKKDS